MKIKNKKVKRKVLYAVIIQYIPIITQTVFSLHEIAFKPIQKYLSSKMKTPLVQNVLKQLKMSEREML